MSLFDPFLICPRCDQKYNGLTTTCNYWVFSYVKKLCFQRGGSSTFGDYYYFHIKRSYYILCNRKNISVVCDEDYRELFKVSGLIDPKSTKEDIDKLRLLL